MLSDKFYKEDQFSRNSKLPKQINKLEELSVAMTELIDNGNTEKIRHLEKLRQKILKDIIKQKEQVADSLKPKISNIFHLNQEMIKKMKEEKSSSLKNIKKKIKFYKSYR